MLPVMRVWILLIVLIASGFAQRPANNQAWAKDTFVRELFLSLKRPSELQEPATPETALNESSMELSRTGIAGNEARSRFTTFKIPLRGDFEPSDESIRTFFEARYFFPGSSLGRIQKDLVRMASLRPGLTAATRDGLTMMDHGEGLYSSGRLVGDPRTIYSSFEIQVDRSQFTVKLFGVKDNGYRSLLFQTRAGLGSSEFPTPHGSFYIMRIFDDKPIWIPPPDREWAWGQMPSRSVYGGHMLPFFNKQLVNSNTAADPSSDDLDHIASQVQMVDGGMYRIHGTDSPWSVGSSQSHGCVRLLNSSVARLADTLKMYVGTGQRGESPNGPYVNLARPVRLILY